ncbi:MAG: hypothetical protein F6J93_29105 [Oscillatoria sp. SIO1A7]|nr:hypothetical protein [Oscillatoria sp. SIO1A7]
MTYYLETFDLRLGGVSLQQAPERLWPIRQATAQLEPELQPSSGLG